MLDNSIGKRIKDLRTRKGLTMEALGKEVGLQRAAINKYESGVVVNIKRATIEQLAMALDTTPAYLMGWDEDYTLYKNVEAMPNMYQVPVVGSIACGDPILAEENIDGFAELDRRIKADFALRCKGDSMINARIFDGDLVFIKAQPDVNNGEIAAVIIENEATLKRVYKYKNRIELRPENPTFPVLEFEGAELDDIRIIGKAVSFLSLIR